MEMTLGQRISMLRKQKELRQDDLAEKLGVSPQAVSKWENDQTCPDIMLLPKLAGILGVTVDHLLSGGSAAVPEAILVPAEQRKDINDMILRIIVDSQDGDKVRVNLPMALVKVAIETGVAMPQMTGNDALSNIDFRQLFELVSHGVMGNLVEVESSDGDTVRIFVE